MYFLSFLYFPILVEVMKLKLEALQLLRMFYWWKFVRQRFAVKSDTKQIRSVDQLITKFKSFLMLSVVWQSKI